MVCAVAIGARGDAYMELGEIEKAIDFYESAVDHSSNDLTAPIYLMKMGNALFSQGNYTEAIESFERIKKEFPMSQEAESIDKYIARAQGMAGI